MDVLVFSMQNPNFIARLRAFHREHPRIITTGCLLAIIALGAFLRFYRLGAAGLGNIYYAAAVKSMLLSWKNFFFVAFEPGGSVSVDKPPLGLWVQTLSTYFLGLTGFALALPNAIAGLLSILVTYKLVRRPFGVRIGLIATLALAITPVAVSTERNNTMDGLLMFVLLLAAWAFLQSAYSGQLIWLMLGALIVGLGFNIKMLQAFMPLPAFYAVYFFGARQGWSKKILHLAAASAVLVVVSFSWAAVVDLTPASARPYVDSSSNNTVMDLIFGHNGLERLTYAVNQPKNGSPEIQAEPGLVGDADETSQNNDVSMNFGALGIQRLFTAPLAGEASWLLPFVLGGLLLMAALLWQQPFGEQHIALILWAGWLLPDIIYFAYSSGTMHTYYLIMLGAPLAVLTAMTCWASGQVIRERPIFGWGVVGLLVAVTLIFQGITIWRDAVRAIWALVLAGFLFGGGLLLATAGWRRARFISAALTLMLAAMLIAPGTWSALTTFNLFPDGVLPYAGPARKSNSDPTLVNTEAYPNGANPGNAAAVDNSELLSYLLANTQPGTYLLATGRSNSAAPYILETGRPVLPLGGFLGNEEILTLDQFSELVRSGQLRFVLDEDSNLHPTISGWIKDHCSQVDLAGLRISDRVIPNSSNKQPENTTLYDCER